jgi:hypothetical protein
MAKRRESVKVYPAKKMVCLDVVVPKERVSDLRNMFAFSNVTLQIDEDHSQQVRFIHVKLAVENLAPEVERMYITIRNFCKTRNLKHIRKRKSYKA